MADIYFGSVTWSRNTTTTTVSDIGFKADKLFLFSNGSNKYIGICDCTTGDYRYAGTGAAVHTYSLGGTTDAQVQSITSTGFVINRPSTAGNGATLYYTAVKLK